MIKIPADKVDEFLRIFKEAFGLLLTNEMRKNVAVDTGLLRESIKYKVTDTGINVFMEDYALYLEFGTAPHVIQAKNGKALAFEPGKKARLEAKQKPGKTVLVKKVMHPGTDPQPFIRPALMKAGNFAMEAAIYAAKEVGGMTQ